MDVTTDNKHLKELFRKGSSKKLKLSEPVIKKFLLRVDAIFNAVTIYDLWNNPSMNFKKLQGYENRYSMRLDQKFRLEMEVTWENEEKTVGQFKLIKISSHYE